MVEDRPIKYTFIILFAMVIATVFIYGISNIFSSSEFFAAIVRHISLGEDRSFAEIINYGFAFLSSVLLFIAFLEIGSISLFSGSIIMAFVWFDDSNHYHELFGRWLSQRFDLLSFPGLRPQDTGEVLAWTAAGLPLLAILLIACVRRRAGDSGILLHFLLGLIGLVICGVVFDLMHVAAPLRFKLVFELVEDGGEMLAITYIAWFSAAVCRNASSYYDNVSR